MKEYVEQRLKDLRAELDTGQRQLGALEARTVELRSTLFRISGAIQVLEDVLEHEQAQVGNGHLVKMSGETSNAPPRPGRAPGELMATVARRPDTLDARTAEDTYREAIGLAQSLIPEWGGYWPDDARGYFAADDPGLVVLKLLARLHSALCLQLNRAPDKHLLAFLDFYGVELRGPQAATTPLTFALVEGAAPVSLPAGTQVASADDTNLLFETTRDLLALPAAPAAAFRLVPAADVYADEAALLGATDGGAGLLPLDHTLYLGSARLLQQATPVAELRVTFEGVNLVQEYFARWTDGAGKVLRPELDLDSYDALSASFADFSQEAPSSVGGVLSSWIAVSPAAGVSVRAADAEILPQIYGIAVTVRSQRLQAEGAYANDTSIDLIKGAQPFGATPAVDDAFYLASNDVFSRVGAAIVIDVEAAPLDPSTSVALSWEHWSDGGWQPLDALDGTLAFTQSGAVTFTCPRMDVVEINGRESRWVRARIAAGGYGSPAGIVVIRSAEYVIDDLIAPYVSDKGQALAILQEHDLNFGYEYRPPSYTPPFVSALQLSYTLTDRPELTVARNGFVDAPLDVLPYRPVPDRESAYYVGFAPESFLRHARGRTLSLLVVLGPADARADGSAHAEPPVWSGFDGAAWRPLKVTDGTNDFTTDGIVEIEIPDALVASSAFDRQLVWLRLSAPEADPTWLPVIARLVPNPVDAVNGVLWTDEILGSGTGAPGVTLEFPRTPVLDGQIVEVLELTPTLSAPSAGGEPLAAGAPSQTSAWIPWVEVPSFAFSSRSDRHYVLDHGSGVLSFGDGVQGMAPPQGVNNIRAASYRSGGGVRGDVGAGTLTVLQRALSDVASVTNVVAARGGVEADDLDVLRTLGPRRMKAQDRAVSAEDFATLALQSSQRVARATAYADVEGRLTVAVLPREAGERPGVTSDLVAEVTSYVKARALFVVADAITVVGPDYLPIDVEVRAYLGAGALPDVVRDRLADRVARFFEPGGSAARPSGWDFGAAVDAPDVAEVLQTVPGVAAIDGVTLGVDSGYRTSITLAQNQLPTAGVVRLQVSHAG